MNKFKIIICIWSLIAGGAIPLMAQETVTEKKASKAWEFGLGGSVFQFSRASFSNFNSVTGKGHQFDLDLNHVVWGGNAYIARELNPYWYLDLQGTVGCTKENLTTDNNHKWYAMVGPGIQWRIGEYFKSKYIEPYLRAGISYMYKDFAMNYNGSVGPDSDEMSWILENFRNKEGRDRTHLMPISVGAGLNMWLNDRWGIGMQADYLVMPYKNVANSIQGTVRFIYRLGGKTKKTSSAIQYIEVEKPVVVERIVEKPVEKIVVKEVTHESIMLEQLFTHIHFEFNTDVLTKDSEAYISKVIEALKKDESKRYLITGFTDARGSGEYNLVLSKKRAKAVKDMFVAEGLPQGMFKIAGAGSKTSLAKASTSNVIRDGDRKVTIELIQNMEYWNYLRDEN
ncbi:OmpA family protein [Bacteroides reticulotermitis]|uniref:OmpA family protein n=1 Tax=Bacteroides reticulotermitis TaxID=1133319 RepID=UPI003A85F081